MGTNQTLHGFLVKPFGVAVPSSRDRDLYAKYSVVALSNGIKLHAVCVVEGSYYYHIKVASESNSVANSTYYYDVIIRFFTDDNNIANEAVLDNYNVQFYSNSPSFMYQYAYLYNKKGYLIDSLYNKLDPDYIDVPPTKTNADMNTSYDKSIYFACRHIYDRRNILLNKRGTIRLKMKSPLKFFSEINDFRSTKMDQAIISEEKKLSKNLDKSKEKNNRNGGKKTSSLSTFKTEDNSSFGGKIKKVAKITGAKSIKAKKKPTRKT